MEDGGQTAFLPREEWAVRPGEENWLRQRCSKGSSGEAIPCQPRPLERRHWARFLLEQDAMAIPDLPDRAVDRVISTIVCLLIASATRSQAIGDELPHVP